LFGLVTFCSWHLTVLDLHAHEHFKCADHANRPLQIEIVNTHGPRFDRARQTAKGGPTVRPACRRTTALAVADRLWRAECC
jgi:hypothetical protein